MESLKGDLQPVLWDQWGVGVWISGCDYLQAGDEGVTGVRGSLWKSKKYLEFFERYCYGANLYVKILFEK